MKCRDGDTVSDEKVVENVDFVGNAVAVPLKDHWKRLRRRRRSRMTLDARDEEESEDEEARERRRVDGWKEATPRRPKAPPGRKG